MHGFDGPCALPALPEPTVEDYCDPHPYHSDGERGRCYCGLVSFPLGGPK